MQLTWTYFGPPRATSIAVPPKPSLIDSYVLGFHEAEGKLFYLCKPDDDEPGLELHLFDGMAWAKASRARAELPGGEPLLGGGYDPGRGVIAWTKRFERTPQPGHRVEGRVVTADGSTLLATTGEQPVVDPEGEDGVPTFEKHALFVFDRGRAVWVCLTRRGIWELDAQGKWTRRCDGAQVPPGWGSAADAVWDPVGRRAVFGVQEQEDYQIVLLAWDGTALERLSMQGLPDLTSRMNDPLYQIGGHHRHGLVLHAGQGKLFAVGQGGWTALPEAAAAPPRMASAGLASDPTRDLLMLGPGKHERAGGSDRNEVFFLLRAGKWEEQGVAVKESPLERAAYGKCQLAHVDGDWFGVGTHSLQAWKWSAGEWQEIIDEDAGVVAGGRKPSQLVVTDRLHAVTSNGAVLALEERRWVSLCKESAAFKQRDGFVLAADPTGRLVVWGGEANGRKLNDTLFFEKGAWRPAKKSSPQPADFKHGNKDGVYVGCGAVFDSALGTMVRFGFEEVAVLQPDETWKLEIPKGYKDNISECTWGHVPIHDRETGETLVLDFEADEWSTPKSPARLMRFDLGGCQPVATVDYPPELARKRQHDTAAHHALAETFCYDPKTKALFAQALDNSTGSYRLDLAEAFAAAKAMGPRTLPRGASGPAVASAEAPVRLYRVADGAAEIFRSEPGAKKTATFSGPVGGKLARKEVAKDAAAKLVEAKVQAGFVPAAKLPSEALLQLVGASCQGVRVGDAVLGPMPASRLGGIPSGVTAKTWPRYRKQPMGFLFQMETGDRLSKHAGVAVFCARNGDATSEEAEGNAVVLLKETDLAKTGEPPEGVPALPAKALELGAVRFEIDEDRALPLGESDPEMGAAVERLQTAKGVQPACLGSKLGGVPGFLQGAAEVKGHRFLCQLDFDDLDVAQTWPDAGLMGFIYVFVREDEKSGIAFWQYT
jgi:hypothetical protein